VNYLGESFREAFHLIIRLDPETMRIALLSIKVSSLSTLAASLLGVPLGACIALNNFRGRRAVITVLNTLLALPTVVVGLFIYSLISSRGPLGSFHLLFTPCAMVIGQCVLVLPLVAALSLAAVQGVDPRARETALTLGATGIQAARTVLREGRFALLAALIAGFGRVFAEVGVSVMLGGNIRWYTRNITTAIALETSRGDFALALALGIILLTVALGINILLQWAQRK